MGVQVTIICPHSGPISSAKGFSQNIGHNNNIIIKAILLNLCLYALQISLVCHG